MHPLAMSVPVESAFAVPSEIGDNKGMVARLISNVLECHATSGSRGGVRVGRLYGYCGSFHPTKAEAVPRAESGRRLPAQTENQRYYPKRELADACGRIRGFG